MVAYDFKNLLQFYCPSDVGLEKHMKDEFPVQPLHCSFFHFNIHCHPSILIGKNVLKVFLGAFFLNNIIIRLFFYNIEKNKYFQIYDTYYQLSAT